MAIGKINKVEEGSAFKRYIGVAPVTVASVNPSKEELEKFYGRQLDNDVNYVSEIEVNGQKIPQVRLDFMVTVDKGKYPDVDLNTKVTFFLRRAPRVSQAGKKQVIDKYGRTAWASAEEINNKQIPVYSNGPANIAPDYRVAYSGEEELIKFLIALLGIQPPRKWDDTVGKYVDKTPEEMAECEVYLEHVEDYFKGNFKELKDIIAMVPDFKVKVLFGVRTADDGKQYQATYNRMFLKNNVSNYTSLEKDVTSAKNNGAYGSTEFKTSELEEYTVEPTEFEQPVNNPFEPATSATPWD